MAETAAALLSSKDLGGIHYNGVDQDLLETKMLRNDDDDDDQC